MVIGIIGNEQHVEECTAKLGTHHSFVAQSQITDPLLVQAQVVFDFSEALEAKSLNMYCQAGATPVFINAVFSTLTGIFASQKPTRPVFGFCGLPGFFNREVVEVSMLASSQRAALNEIGTSLGLKLIQVKDQPGLVTCRVVCMIINEAFEALQQGVASKPDIDLSMKLGTNYPLGPFEWAEKIGQANVKKILNAIVALEGDLRYTPCVTL